MNIENLKAQRQTLEDNYLLLEAIALDLAEAGKDDSEAVAGLNRMQDEIARLSSQIRKLQNA